MSGICQRPAIERPPDGHDPGSVANVSGGRRMATTRLLLTLAVAGALSCGAALRTAPAGAETAAVQPSYAGDCSALPDGSVCLEFVDDYLWAVEDAIIGW